MSTTTTTRTGAVVGSPAISRSAGLPLPNPEMDAQALTNLLKNNFALVVSNRTINAAEGQWLQAIANHPNATAQLKAEVAHKTHGYGLTQGAQRAGVGVFLQTLRSAAATGATTVPGTTPAGCTPIHPPGGTSIPVTVGTTPGGTTVRGLRLGAAPTQGVPHFKGTATFEGEYALRADALTGAYKGVKADKFGTTDVQLPTGGTHNVRDFHYDLGNGKVGMRIIPVADNGGTVTRPDGTQVAGNRLMDDFLRKEMGLAADEPIYALINYIRPGSHSGTIKDLAASMYKTEGGNTHMGAYVGAGKSTHSPENYHGQQWGVKGYPATVQTVSLQGVPQGVLNQNLQVVDTVLNKGVQFPPNYKNDHYKTIDLATTLEFFKRWVRDDPELKSDPKWHTYCSEHKTIVTNVALNLPQNEKAYMEVFGDTEGKKLFGEFKARFKAISGKDLPEVPYFEPLWKKEGITSPATEKGFGKGLAWPAETTVDIMNDFFNVYADFKTLGGPMVAGMLMGFMDTIRERTGIAPEEYAKLAVPVMQELLVAEALTNRFSTPADLQKFGQQKTAELYVILGGKKEDFAPSGTLDPQKMALAQGAMKGLEIHAGDIMARGGMTRDQARNWLNESLADNMEKLRSTPIGDPTKPQFFSPPNITHRLAIGIHDASRFVTIKNVATAVDVSELQPR